MKVRAGFVSNSSSTSFCVVGIAVPSDEYEEKLDFSELESNLNIRYGIDNYYDCVIIGKSIESMNDNQTLHEFKKEVLKMIQKEYDKNVTIKDIEICIDGGNND